MLGFFMRKIRPSQDLLSFKDKNAPRRIRTFDFGLQASKPPLKWQPVSNYINFVSFYIIITKTTAMLQHSELRLRFVLTYIYSRTWL
jgi:hypothetical protein